MTDDNKAQLQEIIQGILDFKVIPFFGSGMSAKFGMKTWGALIDSIKTELGTSTTDYLDVAQEYENKFGRIALIEKIKLETGTTSFNDEDMAVHYQILTMEPPIIYTTNWDQAIETAAEKIGRKRFKISNLKHIVDAPHYSNIIVKFHGDFDSPGNIVFTRNDFEYRKAHEHPLDILFRGHILGKQILFLGYSFSDENIDLLFSKHRELYGTELLPKSYIIAFKDKFDQARVDELAKKNIKTIVLDSVKELEDLIKELNKSVYEKDFSRQIKGIFKAHPSEVLIKQDLENLIDYIGNTSNTDKDKAKKFRHTLLNKRLSDEMENQVAKYLIQLIKSEISMPLREAIVLGFAHIQISKTVNVIDIAFELISFTKYQELNYDIRTGSTTDVMAEIESRLEHELTCVVIFLFLLKIYKGEETANEDQLRRVFEMLRDCEWEKLREMDHLSKEDCKEIVEHFTKKHPSLNRTLNERSIFGKHKTRSQITKELMQQYSIIKDQHSRNE